MALLFDTYAGGWKYLNTLVSTTITTIIESLSTQRTDRGGKKGTVPGRLSDKIVNNSITVFDSLLSGGKHPPLSLLVTITLLL